MITIESFPDLKNIKILIDVCNICYCNKTDNGKPILANLISILHYLVKELEILRQNIICISDPALVWHIDDPKRFERMIESGEVIKSPKKADEFILGYALSCEFCLIISNDKYREYIKQLPSEEWLQDRSVNFMIINGVTILSPNIELERIEILNDEVEQPKGISINVEDINETACSIKMKKIICY